MFMSHIFVVASSKNADKNTIADIAAAILLCNATDLEVSDNGIIQATVPSEEIIDISHMEGVSYVRSDMNFMTK